MSVKNLLNPSTKSWMDIKADTVTATGAISTSSTLSTSGNVTIGGSLTTNNNITVDPTTGSAFLTLDRSDGTTYLNSIIMNTAGVNKWRIGMADGATGIRIFSYTFGDNVLNFFESGTMSSPSTYAKLVTSNTRAVLQDDNGVFGNATSLTKYKTNITEITSEEAEKVYNLVPKKFNFRGIDDSNEPTEVIVPQVMYGFIAEDFELVDKNLCEWDDHTNQTGLRGIKEEKVVPLLIKCVKDQKIELDQLRTDFDDLKTAYDTHMANHHPA